MTSIDVDEVMYALRDVGAEYAGFTDVIDAIYDVYTDTDDLRLVAEALVLAADRTEENKERE